MRIQWVSGFVLLIAVFVFLNSVGCGLSDKLEEQQLKEKAVEVWRVPHGPVPSPPLDFGSVAADRAGHVYVTVSDSDLNAFTMKYNQKGDRLWFNRKEFLPVAMVVDRSGNVYVAGSRLGKESQYGGSVVMKYGPNGNTLWSAASDRYQGWINRTYAMAVDGLGNVYMTGFNSYGGYSITTIKYDRSGNQLWWTRYRARELVRIGMAVTVDKSGNVYISGGHVTLKYDSGGRQLWAADFGGSGMALGRDGGVYICGLFSDWDGPETRKYDTDGNQIWADKLSQPGRTIRPVFVDLDGEGSVYVCAPLDILKYSEAGVRLWSIAYGGIDAALDRQGNVYAAAEMGKYLLRKYDNQGNQVLAVRRDRSNSGWHKTLAMALDGSENIYVTCVHEGQLYTIKYKQQAK